MSADKANLLRARELLAEALDLYRNLGDDTGAARTLWGLGNILHYGGRDEEAITPLEEAIGLFRANGDRFGLAWALHTRALVALKAQEPATADLLAREALGLFSDANDVSGMVLVLEAFAELARLDGSEARAARLFGAASVMRTSSGLGGGDPRDVSEGWLGRENLSHHSGWAQGQGMSVEEAVAYALGGLFSH
jgi:tetratricopeptide (TPR) repeat protein